MLSTRQLAEPRGVVVQGSVSETVPTRLPFEFESLGERALKGFDQPVRAFVVRQKPGVVIPGPESPIADIKFEDVAAETAERLQLEHSDKPSIAVLPFTNMSGDAEQAYFADGIAEDVITALPRFHDLLVIARSSSFTYRGASVDIRQVGRELDVCSLNKGFIDIIIEIPYPNRYTILHHSNLAPVSPNYDFRKPGSNLDNVG